MFIDWLGESTTLFVETVMKFENAIGTCSFIVSEESPEFLSPMLETEVEPRRILV